MTGLVEGDDPYVYPGTTVLQNKRHLTTQDALDRFERCKSTLLTPVDALNILIGMSKRLQVLVDEKELREIQRIAQRHRMTVAEWVRQSLRTARRQVPDRDTSKKLAVVRAAARHAFPTGDIDQLLREIEQGYRPKTPA